MDTRKADAEIEAAKMQAERMRLETQRLRERIKPLHNSVNGI